MRNLRRKMLGMLVAVIALGLGANSAKAGIINGSFETGDFTGWTVNFPGLGAVVTSAAKLGEAGSFSPTDGTYFARLTSGAGAGVYTIMSQAFSMGVGNSIHFDMFFDAGDYMPFNDSGFANVIDADTNTLVATVFASNVATVGNYGSTPWTAVSYTFAAAGNYRIEFGVNNALDNGLASAIGVDNFQAVPVPAGALLMGLGAIGLGAYRLRRRTAVVA